MSRYSRLRARLIAFARKRGARAPEHIAEHAFAIAWENPAIRILLEQYDDAEEGYLVAWLMVTVRNLTSGEQRIYKRETDLDERRAVEQPGAHPDPLETMIHTERRAQEEEARRLLPEVLLSFSKKHRRVLAFRLAGLKQREIAERLGMPLDTVSTCLARDMPKLIRRIRDRMGFDPPQQ